MSIESANPTPKYAYQRAIISLAGVEGLLLMTSTVLGLLLINNEESQLMVIFLINVGLTAIFSLSILLVVLQGRKQVRQIQAFLSSDRPLLRWTYTPEEWRAVKEVIWQEERNDWKIQLGCLTAIFGLIGLLAGVMIGADDRLAKAVVDGAIGSGVGVAIGFALGVAVSGGNYLAAWQSYRRAEPGDVALGPNEIYANDRYFRGDGRSGYIRQAHLERGRPACLYIEMQVPPRPRSASEEEWVIVVPPRLIEPVEAIVPLLASTTRP